MTRKDTEEFLNKFPSFFSKQLTDYEFCLPYKQGWIEPLMKACERFEKINNGTPIVTFRNADYLLTKENDKLIEDGVIDFKYKIDLAFCNKQSVIKECTDIIMDLVEETSNTCEICGANITNDKHRLNLPKVLMVERYRNVCEKCFNDLS